MTDAKGCCQFGCRDANVRRYAFSAGCVCFPDLKEMDLCPQHVMVATPIQDMACIDARGEWNGLR